MTSEQPKKRPKLGDKDSADPALVRVQRAAFLSSMSRDISPPRSSRATPDTNKRGTQIVQSAGQIHGESFSISCTPIKREAEIKTTSEAVSTQTTAPSQLKAAVEHSKKTRTSPFSLTKVRDLPAACNVDTVSLHNILGNPLIKEAWVFNFCFDIDWMMQFFDPDVRDLVQVNIIHGSWRNEDGNKIAIEDACRRWPNVENFKAYLPDPFGTHHSKMFVLFTHDDQAEVIIHTANMLQKDWTNMTQAVWRTGPLSKPRKKDDQVGPIGSGTRFKQDLLVYLKEYKKPAQALHKQLQDYDFDHVRGALVASVPSKLNVNTITSTDEYLWGYPRLREVLSHLEQTSNSPLSSSHQPHLIAQVSSIASLPKDWLKIFIRSTTIHPASNSPTPSLSIIHPTPSNVASSLDGYAAGGSIHTKAHLATHLTQINNLRPHLCQWNCGPIVEGRAGRHAAAPHVKTYIQYKSKPDRKDVEQGKVRVEWALLTSANLSTQAWGSLPRREEKGTGRGRGGGGGNVTGAEREGGIVHIQSFEIGVLVWPELFLEDFGEDVQEVVDKEGKKQKATSVKAQMVPVFGKNTVDPSVSAESEEQHVQERVNNVAHGNGGVDAGSDGSGTQQIPPAADDRAANQADTQTHEEPLTIALRIPYDLPLTPYAYGEMPWSPGGVYMETDSKGAVWDGSGGR